MALNEAEIEARLREFREFCRREGYKVTPQRLEIFRQVAQTETHPEAEVVCEQVRQRMPTVSVDTVYRTLAFLEEHGLVRKLSQLHGSARYDANLRQHHHFICKECGGAWDFYSEELDSFPAPASVQALGAVTELHAELHGICNACRNQAGG